MQNKRGQGGTGEFKNKKESKKEGLLGSSPVKGHTSFEEDNLSIQQI